jgi:hypothetical protein
MNVHSATSTYSCSVELNKQWYTLADFFSNWDISQGFSIFYLSEGTAKLCWAGTGVGGHNMINITIRELYCTFAIVSRGFLYIILISPEGTAKTVVGGGKIICLGCTVAQ